MSQVGMQANAGAALVRVRKLLKVKDNEIKILKEEIKALEKENKKLKKKD